MSNHTPITRRAQFQAGGTLGQFLRKESAVLPVRPESTDRRLLTAVRRDEKHELKLEEQLHQCQKMESIGELVGGVAHDFNNMLGVIIGHSEMILNEMDPDQPHFDNLKEILSAANRSSALTQQLLAFARKKSVAPEILDLNETVGGMVKMLRRLIGEHISLKWQPDSGLHLILMVPSQLDQVLTNLVVNARDAIVGSGIINIQTDLVALTVKDLEGHPDIKPGNFVLLCVRDDGCGMDGQTLEKIFDPFFTTKAVGKSTGLGLSTVFGIVARNNGLINVYSEIGKGTTFKIYLPVNTTPVSSSVENKTDTAVGQGKETILLVEDEPALLHMITIMLEAQGYCVVSAATPGRAVELMESHGSKIQLLLTDVIMPKMNGGELAKKLRAIHPNLNCLFMSGYTADIIGKHGELEKGIHFIEKPFIAGDLAVKIRKAMSTV